MRFLVTVQIPTEKVNGYINHRKFLQQLENYINKVKAEASYFFDADGERTFVFIVNIESAEMLPYIAEPLIKDIGGKVKYHPVMVFEDLKKASEQLQSLQ